MTFGLLKFGYDVFDLYNMVGTINIENRMSEIHNEIA